MALAGNSLSLKALRSPLREAAPFLLQYATSVLGASSARVTSTRRSHSQQKALYAAFLAGKAQYPVAPPGSSKHELGLAVDIVTQPMSVLPHLGAWWNSIGGTWRPSDPIHFEI